MGMFGILVMIGENELSSAGVYTKVRVQLINFDPWEPGVKLRMALWSSEASF
jgi:hypothetical protein